jgi:hypothetical protein
VVLTEGLEWRRLFNESQQEAVDVGSGKLTNCSSGGEGGWGCPGFDRNHADNGERAKGAQQLHGSEAREEKGGQRGDLTLGRDSDVRGGGSGARPRIGARGVRYGGQQRRERGGGSGGQCDAIAWTRAVKGGEVQVHGLATGPVARASPR